MRYYLLFAWRNLWRNKRRTLLAVSSVFCAVVLTLLLAALNYGQDDDIIRNSVSLSLGYLQIQGKGYWDERSFDESFEASDSLFALVRRQPLVTRVTPRIESAALVSHGIETRLSPVLGIDPEAENGMTGLRNRVVRGAYLTPGSRGIMIAEGLAEGLHVAVGDSVVLLSQGYEGTTAAGEFAVEGILHFPIPKMNNALVYLSLKNAQDFFNAPNRLTSIALMTGNAQNTSSIQSGLAGQIDPSLVLLTWQQMSPEIVQSVQLNDAGGLLTLAIFYIVIAFGVFGTVMMMTIERTREFGLLISLGMRRQRLFLVTAIEAILVSMMGVLAGLVVAMPVVLYFHFHPIHVWGEIAKAYEAYGLEPVMSVNADASLFYSQVVIVLLIAIVASLYPLFVLRKIRPVSALQGRGGAK